MRVLITGVNGFIAQYLIDKFAKENIEVDGLDIQKDTALKLKNYFSVDICEKFYLDEEYDYVIHLAAFNRTNIGADNNYALYHKVNVIGTKNVAECCKYKKFIYMSSVNIYDKDVEVITEKSKVNPVGYYARSKWEAENILRKLISDEQLVILRSSNVTGVKQKEVAIIPFFFNNAVNNKDINIFVPQNRTIQFLDVNDLAEAFSLIIKNNISGTFNIVSKNSIEVRQLAMKIVSMCRSKSKINISNPQFEKKTYVSSELISSIINWNAKKDICNILDEYYDYLLKNN